MKHIALEMSLKPFTKPLLKNTEAVSVMLRSADGSEILDYRGNDDDCFKWACYAGNANTDNTV